VLLSHGVNAVGHEKGQMCTPLFPLRFSYTVIAILINLALGYMYPEFVNLCSHVALTTYYLFEKYTKSHA